MLAQRHGLPEIVGRVLAARGIEADAVPGFLKPTLREQLPDPSGFRDMDAAVARLMAAVVRGESVCVWGDYDVDGATATALLQRFFAAIGHPVSRYIPDRLTEGYGPNAAALWKLAQDGVKVVVTVDCGISAFDALAAAAEAGLDVIVLDHHKAEPALPKAHAVVDPNRLDETAGHGQLAAVGVAYLLVVGLNRALRAAGHYGPARPEPDLKQWLDLVALGTVADIVPLTGLNRALVTQGLRILAGRRNVGLAALADVARLGEPPTAYHLGFLFGPRVNAGGRVGAADLGARLLSTEDPVEARELARQLDQLNRERQQIEQAVLGEAIAMVERGLGHAGRMVFVAGEGWHPGVIGIVASRLKDRYNAPACVVALENGVGKGSGRSVAGFDLGSAVIAARQAGLLANGGGHAMAAGFTAEAAKLDALGRFLAERLHLEAGPDGLVPELGFDGVLQPAAATTELLGHLERIGPFGSGNAEPRFALAAAQILYADPVGTDHVRCVVGGAGKERVKAIAFRARTNALGPALLAKGGPALHLAGHLRADRWQGREGVQFVIEDAAAAV
jgi:single-stranded-DNA-specific exonuclease